MAEKTAIMHEKRAIGGFLLLFEALPQKETRSRSKSDGWPYIPSHDSFASPPSLRFSCFGKYFYIFSKNIFIFSEFYAIMDYRTKKGRYQYANSLLHGA